MIDYSFIVPTLQDYYITESNRVDEGGEKINDTHLLEAIEILMYEFMSETEIAEWEEVKDD